MCLPGISQGIGGSTWLLSALMFAVTSRKGSTSTKLIPYLVHNLNQFIKKPANVPGLAAIFLLSVFLLKPRCVCMPMCAHIILLF